ncbi:hypothetical protein D8674_005500 [Pyrus ussuriensis x Pyrus communis]|uniref:Uncharacterized protein n=1 Tax=Pyrus ussuriensis x Pyrus communis TaxID=2448454 RepID=A0A5N5FRZ5_9ROSA|nr:hypothetical protein D8674_005500 [Pyrus ussuriensis x Pyrus communis]
MDLLHHQKGSSIDLGADALRGKLLTFPCRFMDLRSVGKKKKKNTMQPLVQPQIAS